MALAWALGSVDGGGWWWWWLVGVVVSLVGGGGWWLVMEMAATSGNCYCYIGNECQIMNI